MGAMSSSRFSWMGKLFDTGVGRLGSELESASRTVGTVAGTLHRSFAEATRAGVAELKRTTN